MYCMGNAVDTKVHFRDLFKKIDFVAVTGELFHKRAIIATIFETVLDQ